MRELNGAGDAELGEAGDVFGRQALRVLDPVPQPARAPGVLRRLEGVERVAVGEIADCVDGDRKVRLSPKPDQLLELLARGDAHTCAVEQQRGLRAERPVHERLQRTEP